MWRSDSYLDHVRSSPCCYCLTSERSDAHHFGRHGTAIKADDCYTVPLCQRHHAEFHARGRIANLSKMDTLGLFWKTAAMLMAEWVKRLDS